MLITADWVVPVSRRPIRDGAVLVASGRVVEVGTAEDLAGMPDARERFDFPGCVLMPGLVNAHTHLSLSAMEGLLEPDAFERWLPRLVAGMKSWDADDYAASAALGARLCLQAGVTVVGDIVYGPESAAAAGDAGLGGTFYWEVLGIDGPSLYAALERMEFPGGERAKCGPRMRCGLSPHSAYTSGLSLLRAVHEAANEMGLPVAIHVAESAAETQLLKDGTGPLAQVLDHLLHDFEPPGVSPIAYLDRLGVLDGAAAVHLGQALPTDIPRLAATTRGTVTCPRSNHFLDNARPKVRRMLNAGIPVGVGTDSSASNQDLDLFEELRVLQEDDPTLDSAKLIELVTAMGAIVLGLEDRFGFIERGMQADFAIFRTGRTASPEDELVRVGGRKTLEAVMSAGVWRLLSGAPTQDTDAAVLARTKTAAEKARAAMGSAF